MTKGVTLLMLPLLALKGAGRWLITFGHNLCCICTAKSKCQWNCMF